MSAWFRFAPHGRQRLHDLDHILDVEYGAPEELLGNQSDPLDEAVYIILSFQTNPPRFKETWQCLKAAFRRWEDVERVSVNYVAGVLRVGGPHWQKANAIKYLLRSVRSQFGELSLEPLREMPDVCTERMLTRLPGISWKAAKCIMLYSLDRLVFPLDGNTFRILKRTGVIPLSAVYRRLSLHDAIQAAIAPDRRRRFHVNLVVHGQEVYLSQRPQCTNCPAAGMRPKRGLCRYSQAGQVAEPSGQQRFGVFSNISSQLSVCREVTVSLTSAVG